MINIGVNAPAEVKTIRSARVSFAHKANIHIRDDGGDSSGRNTSALYLNVVKEESRYIFGFMTANSDKSISAQEHRSTRTYDLMTCALVTCFKHKMSISLLSVQLRYLCPAE